MGPSNVFAGRFGARSDGGQAGWSAIVLNGGRSSRMGSRKDVLRIDGIALVDRIIRGLPPDVPVVVVGQGPVDPGRDVVVTREQPVGGGPVAGIAAGLTHVDTPMVAVCAADMPFAAEVVVDIAEFWAELADDPRARELEALVASDASGQRQPLCAVYRVDPLTRALRHFGNPSGRSMRELLQQLDAGNVLEPDDDLLDVDTPADLARAEAALRRR